MVLAAGLGTRLRPLTDLLPKPLVPVLGVPVVEGTLDLLRRAGVGDVVLNLHHLGDVLREALAHLAGDPELRLRFLEEPEILGTGGGVGNAASFLRDAGAILVVNGDTLLDVDLRSLLAAHRDQGAAATLLVRENPDPAVFAPVETGADLRVRRIAGRPGPPEPGLKPWLFAGVHVLSPETLELLPPGAPSDINRVLHPALIARGSRVFAYPFAGAWSDVGTPERLLEANLALLDRPPARLLELAELDGYRIDSGTLIGRDVGRAAGSSIARSVLGHGAAIGRDARVLDSMLFPGAAVESGAVVRSCLLGPMARVAQGREVTAALIVGEHAPIPLRLAGGDRR